MSNSRFLTALVFVLLLPAEVAAERVKARTIPCPPIIGDKETGTFSTTRKSSSQRYQCFSSAKDAKRSGFLGLRALARADFTGWYRLRVRRPVKNTCGSYAFGASGTLFLQLLQNESGVFGEFCPRTGTFSGSRTEHGLILSSITRADTLAGSSLCAGPVEYHQILELVPVVSDDPLYQANYRVTYRCLDPDEGAVSCVEEVEGVVFPETHPIWPGVSSNISALTPSCGVALAKCQDCHDALKDFPPINPEGR